MILQKHFTFKVLGEEIYYKIEATSVKQAELKLLNEHKELNLKGFKIVKEDRPVLLYGARLA